MLEEAHEEALATPGMVGIGDHEDSPVIDGLSVVS
mgnify:CR=1 FL=1